MSNPGKPDGGETPMREALVAAVPFLFEHAGHAHPQCYRGPDDRCYCGLDEAQKLMTDALAPSPQPSAEGTLPTQTRISRACIAAANHLKELHVITYEANTVADIIYRHIRQALMEEYDGKL